METKQAETDILTGCRILIVEDRELTVEYLIGELQRRVGQGGLVKLVKTAAEALKEMFGQSPPSPTTAASADTPVPAQGYDVVLVDILMAPMDGYDLTKKIREKDDDAVIVLMTAHTEYKGHESLAKIHQVGANGYLAKDTKGNVDLCAARDVEIVAGAVRSKSLLKKLDHIQFLEDWNKRGGVIAQDPRMVQVLLQVDRFAQSDDPVLLLGETGVGKDVIAEAIHKRSRREHKPFQAVVIPECRDTLVEEFFGVGKGAYTTVDGRPGLFEAADGGTIFLNEIGEMRLEDQSVLLGVLQTKQVRRKGETRNRHVDVRIIAATLQPLQEMVDQGRFRADLFRRLNFLKMEIPPLRERRGDIAPLAELFLKQVGRGLRFAPGCMEMLQSYSWPQNVGQLNAVIKAAALNADPAVGITAFDIELPTRTAKPGAATATPTAVVPYDEAVATLLENSLATAGGDAGRAEEMLRKGDSVRGRWLRRQAESLKEKIEGFGERFPRLAGLGS